MNFGLIQTAYEAIFVRLLLKVNCDIAGEACLEPVKRVEAPHERLSLLSLAFSSLRLDIFHLLPLFESLYLPVFGLELAFEIHDVILISFELIVALGQLRLHDFLVLQPLES
jgi:hypothetical protein